MEKNPRECCMVLETVAVVAGKKVLEWVASEVGDEADGLIGDRKKQAVLSKGFGQAVQTIFDSWETDHRQLVAEGFDLSFLEREGAAQLAQLLLPAGQVDGVGLAMCWALTLGRVDAAACARLSRAEMPAAEFLSSLERQLRTKPAFSNIFKRRDEFRRTQLLEEHARAAGAEPITSAVRRGYLHWVASQYELLNSRGIRQTQALAISLPLEKVYVPSEISAVGLSDPQNDREFSRRLGGLHARRAGEDLHADGGHSEIERLTREFGFERVQAAATTIDRAVVEHNGVVVLGEPGSGKTTALRWLAVRNARRILVTSPTGRGGSSTEELMPFLVRALDYVSFGEGQSLRDFIVEDLRRRNCAVAGLGALVREQVAAGTCLILIDGLDEAIDPVDRKRVRDQIESFRTSIPQGNRVIVTSRFTGYLAAQLSEVFAGFLIRPMSRASIEQFLRGYCPEVEARLSPELPTAVHSEQAARQVSKLLDAIDRSQGVRRLAATPLLLTAMTLIGRNDATLPAQRSLFYQRVVETLGSSWRFEQTNSSNLPDETLVHRVLRKAAMHLRQHDPGGTVSAASALEVLGDLVDRAPFKSDDPDDTGLTGRAFVKFLGLIDEHCGLIVERAHGVFAFSHLTFEEFYAAQFLATSHSGDIRARLHEARWSEPVLLALGLMQPDKCEEAIETELLAWGDRAADLGLVASPHEDRILRDTFFACRAIADGVAVSPSVLQRLTARLVENIRNPDGLLHMQTTAAISLIAASYPDALAALLTLASDENGNVRSLTATGLTRVAASVPAAVDVLLTLSRDENSNVRAVATGGLRGVAASVPAALDALLNLANDESNDVRFMTATGLRELAASVPAALDALISLARDENSDFRSPPARGLRLLAASVPAALEALLSLGNDESNDVRSIAAGELSKLAASVPAALDALLNLANDENNHVRSATAKGLSEVAASVPAALDALLNLANDESNDVRSATAKGLSEVAASVPAALDALLNLANDESNDVRRQAANGLSEVAASVPAALDALLNLANDKDFHLRAVAARGLTLAAASVPAALEALLTLVCDENRNVRFILAVGLSGVAASVPAALDALLKLAHDENSNVRQHAAEGLGGVATSDPAALDALIAFAIDETSTVRSAAAAGLSRVAASVPAALHALVNLASDESSDVRQHAAEGLRGLAASVPAALDALMTLTSDESSDVRWAAAKGLSAVA
jgi:HEAT repeat protein